MAGRRAQRSGDDPHDSPRSSATSRQLSLQIPQSDWDFGCDALSDTCEWSLTRRGSQTLAVGGSLARWAAPRSGKLDRRWLDGIVDSDELDCKSSCARRLLDGAKRVQDEFQRSKDHFVERIVDSVPSRSGARRAGQRSTAASRIVLRRTEWHVPVVRTCQRSFRAISIERSMKSENHAQARTCQRLI